MTDLNGLIEELKPVVNNISALYAEDLHSHIWTFLTYGVNKDHAMTIKNIVKAHGFDCSIDKNKAGHFNRTGYEYRVFVKLAA